MSGKSCHCLKKNTERKSHSLENITINITRKSGSFKTLRVHCNKQSLCFALLCGCTEYLLYWSFVKISKQWTRQVNISSFLHCSADRLHQRRNVEEWRSQCCQTLPSLLFLKIKGVVHLIYLHWSNFSSGWSVSAWSCQLYSDQFNKINQGHVDLS